MKSHQPASGATESRLSVFVDSSVIGAYLAGEEASVRLIEDSYPARVRFVVDPVVLQNVLVLPEIQAAPELFEKVRAGLQFDVLPLRVEQSEPYMRRASSLRSRMVHSSDILVAADARDCDYLITYAPGLKQLIEGERPRVVTPEEFISLVPAA